MSQWLSKKRCATILKWLKEGWPIIFKYGLGCVAAVLLGTAVVLALLDRVAAATLVAGLFVVVALFNYLPDMESFKAFGIEAKLRAKLTEAEDILRKLRRSAEAMAQLTYHTLGWGSRMGGLTAKRKQTLADEIDVVLTDLGIEPTKLAELKKHYLFFVKYDLFEAFDAIVQLSRRTNLRRLTERLGEAEEGSPEANELAQKRNVLAQEPSFGRLMDVLPRVEFRQYCHARIPTGGLSSGDEQKLRDLADRVANLTEQSDRTGRVSDETVELLGIRLHEKRNQFYRELFGEEPVV
jgi:hypothetical protein